jgi:rfaE bifunctional protein nucleotidyltransferase chain/domain
MLGMIIDPQTPKTQRLKGSKSPSCCRIPHLLSSNVAMSAQKIRTLNEIIQSRARLRKIGKKVVFTNGCFDILHVGHVRYLNEAKSFGDALIVAINSDRSVREIKGESRPVVPEMDRAEVIASLACVDYVLIFDDPTPKQVIDAIVPDVLVKGADWGISEIVGRDTVENAGGRVLNIRLVEGSSTTQIIQRVLERFGGANRPEI